MSHIRGSEEAPIKLVVFSGYECVPCISSHQVVKQILETFPDKVSFDFRHLPIPQIHQQAIPSAIAAECASKQNHFWEMHDRLFNITPGKLSTSTYLNVAKELKLNQREFQKCLIDPDIQEAVVNTIEKAHQEGVYGTPTLFINGSRFNEKITFENLKNKIEKLL